MNNSILQQSALHSVLIISAFLLSFSTTFGQAEDSDDDWGKKLEQYQIKLGLGVQFWGTYTLGEEKFNTAKGEYEPVDDRLNFQFRRLRFEVKGQPYKNLGFGLTFASDLVGRDILGGSEAGAANGSIAVSFWNAYLQWRLKSGSESAFVTTGYFVPQIGRESINSYLRVGSMEKAWSQNYFRRHFTGIGPGRATGVALGGLLADGALRYDVGVFNPNFEALSGQSSGTAFAPLFTGRIAWSIGQPEAKKYALGATPHPQGRTKGLTLAIGGVYNSATDLFDQNYLYGADVLLNLGQWSLDADWHLMYRITPSTAGQGKIENQTGYVRLAYRKVLSNTRVLEPVITYWHFEGSLTGEEQALAAVLKLPAGIERNWDFALNYYFNPDLKFTINYNLRSASAGAAGMGSTVNNYYTQSGVGAIRRGNWLGLGLSAIL